MRVSPLQFERDGQKIAALMKRRGGHPVLVEAGGAPEAPDVVFDGNGRAGTGREVEAPEFARALKSARIGLLYGGELKSPVFVREDELPLPGLPDIIV